MARKRRQKATNGHDEAPPTPPKASRPPQSSTSPPRQRRRAPSPPRAESVPSIVEDIQASNLILLCNKLGYLVLACSVIPTCELLLHPVYGSAAAQRNLRLSCIVVIATAGYAGKRVWHPLVADVAALALPLLYFSTTRLTSLAFHFGDHFGARWSVLASYAICLFPILALSAFVFSQRINPMLTDEKGTVGFHTWAHVVVIFLAYCVIRYPLSWLRPDAYFSRCRYPNILGWLSIPLSLTHFILSHTFAPIQFTTRPIATKACYAILGSTALRALFSSPPAWCHPGPGIPLSLDASHNTSLVRLLDRRDSVTGFITVGEYAFGETWLRLLRCDHSLLGGLWIGHARAGVGEMVRRGGIEATVDAAGLEELALTRADSVYLTFVMQEAVRLIERPPPRDALIIGLGVGIAARALIEHGLRVTVCEIDPAVYDFARRYFALPEPDTVHLEDARKLLKRAKGLVQYDVIVHDVFTGGSVPPRLFTRQCWDDVREALRPQGVLVTNFAGRINSKAGAAVLATLQRRFEYCRAFQDHPPAHERDDFKNLVIFCSRQPITFRAPVKSDYLGSKLREDAFANIAAKEVDIGTNAIVRKGKQLTDRNAGKLAKWQRGSAIDHWYVMRETLSGEQWRAF